MIELMARKAMELKAEVRSDRILAVGGAFIAFWLVVLVLWLWRVVRAPWLHWLLLLAIPAAVAIGVMWWRADNVRSHLRMQENVLDTIRKRSPGSAEARAADNALSLIGEDRHGSLAPTLALWPAGISAAMAFLLLVGVWYTTNRRVMKSV